MEPSPYMTPQTPSTLNAATRAAWWRVVQRLAFLAPIEATNSRTTALISGLLASAASCMPPALRTKRRRFGASSKKVRDGWGAVLRSGEVPGSTQLGNPGQELLFRTLGKGYVGPVR